eukprot:m.190955 g.190955  ORF g.190955 m.190955 type:complete len:593 (+) comp18578_c0_seq1:56-1834(+)
MLPLVVLVVCTITIAQGGPIAQTEYGPVEGVEKSSGVKVFHGIPFAAPPVKDLRWKPARAPQSWSTPIPAVQSTRCPQFDIVRALHLGKEDCLHLSVYTPSQCTRETPCPVMQWIYGGAWEFGSNSFGGAYDGENLALKHGVVVVAANYRLDALGWIALAELGAEDPDSAYGNYGLRDQTFALQWTQRNVLNFGGDKNMVTIFGQSAGGFSVCQHLVSPESNGLFSHAIMQSGSCDGPWLIFDGDNAKRFGSYYADAVGCPAGNGTGAARLECLRRLPVALIMEPYINWFCPFPRPNDPYCNATALPATGGDGWTQPRTAAAPWPAILPACAPVIVWAAVTDGTRVGLPDMPLRLIQQGKINRSPTGAPLRVMMGTTQDEFALFVAIVSVVPGISLPIDSSSVRGLTKRIADYHPHWGNSTQEKILAHYPSQHYAHEAYRTVVMGTDVFFRCPTRQAARALTAAGVHVYLYHFDYKFPTYIDPASRVCELDSEIVCGVYHSSEIKYAFGNEGTSATPEQQRVGTAMSWYWAHFAKTGTPNGQSVSAGAVQPPQWPLYDTASDQHMNLNADPSVGTHLAKSSCDFFDRLPPYV